MKPSTGLRSVALALAVLLPTYAAAQTAEEFYRGKTVTIYIGFSPGGSYDYFGRLIARFMGRHIPGAPAVVAQNMPGAGSFTAANFLFTVAPKDGTALGIVSQNIALEEALRTPGVAYKTAEFNWIGRTTSIVEITLTWADKAKSIAEVKTRETPVASTGPGSPSEGYPRLLNAIAGTKFKVIRGYPGSTDGMLAVERGEVDGSLTSWQTLKVSRKEWLAEKKINLLVQYTRERSPELPDVPAVVELGSSPEDRQMLTFYASGGEIGRSFLAPPGIPADRVAALRAAFDAAVKDPELLAEIQKTGSEFNPLPGDKLQKIILETANAPPAMIERMQKLLKSEP